ncbi:MAG: aminodeoxychorismate/anthranilate synthase component II [Planctomycetes bacterium]|nr:aminodeoxychorismate/anthranilate synthase component II [Planctomycetota bacterium]
MVVLVDNYDSFVYNLAHYLQELGRQVLVTRNDTLDVQGIAGMRPEAVVISPGPCDPRRAGISLDVVRQLGGRVPLLGVCLGHQCIGEAYGGRVVRAPEPMHGRTSPILHSGQGIFHRVPSPFQATRYHSLIVDARSLPEELEVTARTPDGLIMALQHRKKKVVGVQFHPESILTEHGHRLLQNFLDMVE